MFSCHPAKPVGVNGGSHFPPGADETPLSFDDLIGTAIGELPSRGIGPDIPFENVRVVGENPFWDTTDDNDVPGVMDVTVSERKFEAVLIVVEVDDSVIVAVESVCGRTTGECGADCARACSSSSRREGDGSLESARTRSGFA